MPERETETHCETNSDFIQRKIDKIIDSLKTVQSKIQPTHLNDSTVPPPQKKIRWRGWRDGSALSHCSPKGPEFGSQDPHQAAHYCLQLHFQNI